MHAWHHDCMSVTTNLNSESILHDNLHVTVCHMHAPWHNTNSIHPGFHEDESSTCDVLSSDAPLVLTLLFGFCVSCFFLGKCIGLTLIGTTLSRITVLNSRIHGTPIRIYWTTLCSRECTLEGDSRALLSSVNVADWCYRHASRTATTWLQALVRLVC